MTCAEVAEALNAQGIGAIPIKLGKKTPAIEGWKSYQDTLPTEFERLNWWKDENRSIAAVGGIVQCIDFDEPELIADYIERGREAGSEFTISTLLHVQTPRGGHHLIFRSVPNMPNMKLANTEENNVLIETRGFGGYFLTYPSPGYQIIRGDISAIPFITEKERGLLLDLARSFNEKHVVPEAPRHQFESDGETPGDDFDQRGDIEQLLIDHDWTKVSAKYWRRPGKDRGISASFGAVPGRFYVFSTSTGFEPNHVYKPYAVYAQLEHGGDYRSAMKELYRQGFGKRLGRDAERARGVDREQGVSEDPKQAQEPQSSSQGPESDLAALARESFQALKDSGALKKVESTKKARELPNILSFDEEESAEMIRPPELVAGLLYQGAKMMVAGPSKARKTYTMTDLAISVASGSPWLGFTTIRAGVLYINLELQDFAFRDRRRAIQMQKFGNVKSIDLYVWNLRGFGVSLAEIRERIVQFCLDQGIGLIIIDPTYKLNMSGEENAAGDVGHLLNEFEMIAREADASLCFAHHFAKGNAGEKDSIDRASGSGVWARDPDAIVTINNHEDEDKTIFEFDLRNFKKIDPMVFRWEYPIWVHALEADPIHKGTKKSTGGRPRKVSPDELEKEMSLLGKANLESVDHDGLMRIFSCGPTALKDAWKLLREKREKIAKKELEDELNKEETNEEIKET